MEGQNLIKLVIEIVISNKLHSTVYFTRSKLISRGDRVTANTEI